MKAEDNPFPSVLLTEGTVPASPAAGKRRIYFDSADHVFKAVDSAGAVTTLSRTDAALAEYIRDTMGTALVAGSNVTLTVNDAGDTITIASTASGSAAAPVVVRKTDGNMTINSSSWMALSSGADLVVPSLVAGDKVAIEINAIANAVGNTVYLDYATWVSGAKVNHVSATQAAGSDYPLPGWRANGGTTQDIYFTGGRYIYTVQAGDLVAGTVTFRLHGKGDSATARNIYGGVSTFFYAIAQKL